MQAGIITIDLHGKTQFQARTAIDAQLRRVTRATYRLRLIHGHNQGTALREMIRADYAHHAKVLRLDERQAGITELILREF